MPKKLSEKEASLTLSEMERKQLMGMFLLDDEEFKKFLTRLSMLFRSFEGKPIEKNPIQKLINLDDYLERSRFMTYPSVGKQVYFYLIPTIEPTAKPFLTWAELEARAMISYKGQSREEFVDISKKQAEPPEQQSFFLGPRTVEQPPKRRFWQRGRTKPQRESSEFKE